jgi:hypothetical protein
MKQHDNEGQTGLLSEARVFLLGPMDFVASCAAEKASGWPKMGFVADEIGFCGICGRNAGAN